MKLAVEYWQLVLVITALWIAARALAALKNRRVDRKRELKLLTVYVCFIVLARIVYFPMHHVNGRIAPLRFDAERILPPWVNLLPLQFVFETYPGWQINLAGNIAMFLPVGIVWPLCFAKLDRVWKVVLAGFGLSLFIELSQLLFYERNTDVDDLLCNTLGVLLGAALFFGIRKWDRKRRSKACATEKNAL